MRSPILNRGTLNWILKLAFSHSIGILSVWRLRFEDTANRITLAPLGLEFIIPTLALAMLSALRIVVLPVFIISESE